MIRRHLRHLSLAALLAAAGAHAQDALDVVMETAHGDIRLELYADRAPITVANFLRYVDAEHYDGATFYRTVTYDNDNGSPKIEVIQGGTRADPPPFDPIAHEPTGDTGILHEDGVISMARDTVGSAATEFFICIGDQPGLDQGETRNPDEQGFAAFGRVVDGMDVVKKIHRSPADAPGYSAYVAGQIIEEPVAIHRIRRAED